MIPACSRVSKTWEKSAAQQLRRKVGEKRTGPALNPLKGSSARFSLIHQRCNHRSKLDPFVFNKPLSELHEKKSYPREKLLIPFFSRESCWLLKVSASDAGYWGAIPSFRRTEGRGRVGPQ